jgi:hypothetical protein
MTKKGKQKTLQTNHLNIRLSQHHIIKSSKDILPHQNLVQNDKKRVGWGSGLHGLGIWWMGDASRKFTKLFLPPYSFTGNFWIATGVQDPKYYNLFFIFVK